MQDIAPAGFSLHVNVYGIDDIHIAGTSSQLYDMTNIMYFLS